MFELGLADVNCYDEQLESPEHDGLCIAATLTPSPPPLHYTELETHVAVEPKAEPSLSDNNTDKLARKRLLNKKSSRKYREKQKVKEVQLLESLKRLHLVSLNLIII